MSRVRSLVPLPAEKALKTLSKTVSGLFALLPYAEFDSYGYIGIELNSRKHLTCDTLYRIIIKQAKSVEKGTHRNVSCNHFVVKTRNLMNKYKNLKGVSKMFGLKKENDTSKLSERQKIAQLMGLSINNLSATDNLAVSTIAAIKTVKDEHSNSYLCRNDLACCDAVIFSCFFLRALCIGTTGNRDKAVKFSIEYLKNIRTAAISLYMPSSSTFDQMFENRTSFYDRVFMSKSGIENKVKAILEEFKLILETDVIVEGVYEPFSESSPLPVLSIFEDFQCQVEVQSFIKELPKLVSPYLKKVQHELQKK